MSNSSLTAILRREIISGVLIVIFFKRNYMNKENWKSKYFTAKEFECKCGCETLEVDDSFLVKLERAREIAETIDSEYCSYIPTSGCRCDKHNKSIGGKEHSLHKAGDGFICHAVDLSANSDRKRAVVMISLLMAGFMHLGVDKLFIHVDDSSKIGIWLYP